MIRPATAEDATAVVSLAVSSGLFAADDAAVVEELVVDHFGRTRGRGHASALDLDGDDPVGVAYWQPAQATDGCWYLTMIGVRQDRHREGRGAALLRHVEEQLRGAGQRLLLVETSSTTALDPARRFYRAQGYEQEATVRDYYEPGDDMVLFRKDLQT